MTEAEYESIIAKLREQVAALENEVRCYPAEATDIANLQTAVYGLMTDEVKELGEAIDAEKREFEEFKARHEARYDRMLEFRRNLQKRLGGNMEDMTRRALAGRPEDPRTALLRKEFEDYRERMDRLSRANAETIGRLKEELDVERSNNLRNRADNGLDAAQLQRQVTDLQSRLSLREQELMSAKQRIDELQQSQAFHQQQLMAKLAHLESPSIGTVQTLATNQSREARMVKIPSWMRLGK